MIDEVSYSYSEFKAISARKKFFWQHRENPKGHEIWGYDLPTKYTTFIYKPDTGYAGIDEAAEAANLADFLANYLADCNRPNTISPTAAQTQFFGKTIEMTANDTVGFCEWSFPGTTYISKVMPMPIEAQKGDVLQFEVWVKPGVMGPDAVKVGQYGFDIPVRGTGGMGWIYGSGGGEIKSYCTVRCYYHKLAGTARDFNVIAEFLV
jgi:hypothetical protein